MRVTIITENEDISTDKLINYKKNQFFSQPKPQT